MCVCVCVRMCVCVCVCVCVCALPEGAVEEGKNLDKKFQLVGNLLKMRL